MSRLEPLTRDRMDEEQRATFDSIVESRSRVPKRGEGVYEPMQPRPEGPLGGPFDPWLRSPRVADRLVAIGGALRFQTSLPARLIELAILVTARAYTAQYEWYAHERFAHRAGIEPEIIDAIKRGEAPSFEKEDDAAVYAFATELHAVRRVSDAIYARAREQIGERGVVELTALLGYYALVSMTLNTFEVELPSGAEPPLEG